MWKQLIETLTPDHEFGPPALWADVSLAEEKLAISFPDDLRNLLFEANGVQGEYGLGLIWPVERIVADNLRFRTFERFKDMYMPFDALLFLRTRVTAISLLFQSRMVLSTGSMSLRGTMRMTVALG